MGNNTELPVRPSTSEPEQLLRADLPDFDAYLPFHSHWQQDTPTDSDRQQTAPSEEAEGAGQKWKASYLGKSTAWWRAPVTSVQGFCPCHYRSAVSTLCISGPD